MLDCGTVGLLMIRWTRGVREGEMADIYTFDHSCCPLDAEEVEH